MASPHCPRAPATRHTGGLVVCSVALAQLPPLCPDLGASGLRFCCPSCVLSAGEGEGSHRVARRLSEHLRLFFLQMGISALTAYLKPAAQTSTPQPTMTTPSSRACRATSAMTTCGKPRRRSRAPRMPSHLPASSFTKPEGTPPQPGTGKPPGSFLAELPSRVRRLGRTKGMALLCKRLVPTSWQVRGSNFSPKSEDGGKAQRRRPRRSSVRAVLRSAVCSCPGSGSPG